VLDWPPVQISSDLHPAAPESKLESGPAIRSKTKDVVNADDPHRVV